MLLAFHEELCAFHAGADEFQLGAGAFQFAAEPLLQAGGAWLNGTEFTPVLVGAKDDVVGLGAPDVITGPL